MKNKKFLLLFVLATTFPAIGGCSTADPLVECFGTYSTVKVSQNSDHSVYYDKLPAKIDVSLMQNESEAGQVVFKFGQDIKNFTVEVSDLVSQNNKIISKDNVTVYMQRYLELDKDFDNIEDFPTGTKVPDFLLPVEYAISSNENSISKDEYQGFVVDIKSNSDTAGGVYTGTIKFDFDGTIKEIPVSATVWGFQYEGTREMKSSFLVYKSSLLAGEYSASDELAQAYTDMLTDFKVNAMLIETPDKFNIDTMKSYVDNQVRMVNENPNYSSIPLPIVNIPYSFSVVDIPTKRPATLTDNQKVVCMLYDFIHSLVLDSSNDINYLKYAYLYLTNFDEMDMYREAGGGYERGLKFFAKGGQLEQILNLIVKRITNDGELLKFNIDKREEIVNSILNIDRVNPLTTFDSTIVETLDQISCPYISQLENSEYYARYDYNREENANGQLWTYTCVGPKAPYPTFHLGDYNLGSRTTGWTMKRRNVTGYLYYAVNIYSELNNAANGEFVDPYTSPTRNADCPGDGFLVYPGRKYGSKSPFPSNRLLVFRDGMDDYDLLSVYERELKKAEETYGVEFDFESLMNEVYDKVITNALYVNDDKAVLAAREEIANRILALQSDDKLLVNSHLDGDKVVTEIYSLYNSFNINGSNVTTDIVSSGRGYKCTYTSNVCKADSLKILSMTSNLTYDISYKDYLNDFKSTNDIKVSDGSNVSTSDNKLICSMKSVDKGSTNANRRFQVYVDIANNDLANVRGIDFTIKNDGDKPLSMNVLLDGVTSKYTKTIYLYPNQERNFHYNFVLEDETKIANATGLRFELGNYDETSGDIYSYERNFTISDVSFYK